jgi:lipopolysaccharide export system permease protein
MIFRRALISELTATSVGIFIVLLGIVFTMQLVRLLGEAAGGTVAPEGVIALLGFRALRYFPNLLQLSLFLSVLLVVSRAYRDSEMMVWFTSGQSLTAWLKPISLFAAPIVFTIGLLSLWLSPWAMQKSEEFQRILEAREEVTALAPGLFKEIKRGKRLLVVFLDSFNPLDNSIRNVFVQSSDQEHISTVVAQSGYLQEMPNGDRFIVAKQGRRYEGAPGSPDYRIVDFEHYGVRLEASQIRDAPPTLIATPTSTLMRENLPSYRAELYWRIGMPISALLLVFLAVPLSYVNPRVGRSINLIAAILLWFIYSINCANLGQSWVAQQKLSLAAALFVVHGTALVLVVWFFRRRLSVYRLFSRRR